MPFYGKKKKVLRFEYRDVLVEVFEAPMGATHCDLEHEPEAVKCEICGHPIRPLTVLIAYCNDEEVNVFHRVPLLRIRREMEAFIDKVMSRRDDDDTGDPPQDDDEILPEGTAPIDGDPPKKPDDIDLPDDDGEKAGPPSLSDSIKPPAKGPADKLAKIADRMTKLGWINKAKLVIKEYLGKDKKPAT